MTFHVSDSCPFTIQEIQLNGATDAKTYLIRERDHLGDFPHIYAKICTTTYLDLPKKHVYHCLDGQRFKFKSERAPKVIVLSDTGSGTEAPNTSSSWRPSPHDGVSRHEPEIWNISSFLEYTINPGRLIPYLVMTTHCHYDHIMGIGKLPPTSITVLSSSHSKSFISPYSNLQRNSLCAALNLQAPKYNVDIWAEDLSQVVYTSTISSSPIRTPYTILHTPGHTPDSLAWYDSDLRLLCVGDSLYVKETSSTRGAKWGSEPPMPTTFDLESDLKDWFQSLNKVLQFVRERNQEVRRENETANVADGMQEAEDEDEGFVIIDTEDARSDKDIDETETRTSKKPATLPSFPAPVQKRAIIPATKTTTLQPTKLQKQTGFDIPPLEQRSVVAAPIRSTSSLLTPTITPTHLNPSKLDSDPWMMIEQCMVALPPSHRPSQFREVPYTPKTRGLTTADLSLRSRQSTPSTASSKGPKLRPRVLLCAAHTTLSLDAEDALVAMRSFMYRVLRGDVPCKRVENGPRGEECWLWDFATDDERLNKNIQRFPVDERERFVSKGGISAGEIMSPLKGSYPFQEQGQSDKDASPTYGYSLLSPLSVIEKGRREILGDHSLFSQPRMQDPRSTTTNNKSPAEKTIDRFQTSCLTCCQKKGKYNRGKPACMNCTQGGFPCYGLSTPGQEQENRNRHKKLWSSSGGIV